MSAYRMLQARWIPILHDILWTPAAIYLAYLLRFNLGPIPPENLRGLISLLIIGLLLHTPFIWWFGSYRSLWRYSSLSDFIRIGKTIVLGMFATSVMAFILYRGMGIPRSVLLIYPLILTVGLTLARLTIRLGYEYATGTINGSCKRALIVGTGRASEVLLRTLQQGGDLNPVALIAESKNMIGAEIHGVRVAGVVNDIQEIAANLHVKMVILALNSEHPSLTIKVLQICAENNLQCRTVGNGSVMDAGSFSNSRIRKITVEDLLARNPVAVDTGVNNQIQGKSVLVTGGGGSIGSELCSQILAANPASLIVLDNNEYNLYRIEIDLRGANAGSPIQTVLGDVSSSNQIESIFEEYRPQLVFHAAAYKHVPLLEANPAQALMNNVSGTRTLADAACKFGAERFVFISTDKAVNPTSVMGATKRIGEIYCQYMNQTTDTSFITVRFGNVLGSAGSVVPLFESQIAEGGPVTVTHAETTRYLMTIPEAVSLILAAASTGAGGELFVLDMGNPVNIRELAEHMIRISGFEPGRDIPITFTGLRPGEKLHEELFYNSEDVSGTSHPHLLLAEQTVGSDLHDDLQKFISVIDGAIRTGEFELAIQQMSTLVPEFKHKLTGLSKSKRRDHIRLLR